MIVSEGLQSWLRDQRWQWEPRLEREEPAQPDHTNEFIVHDLDA